MSVYIIVPGNHLYIALTAFLTTVAVCTFLWAATAPSKALQVFWWVALLIVAGMVVIDARAHAADGVPVVVAVPSLATVLVRLWSGARASLRYGVGVVALLVPVGMVYGGWQQVGLLLGVIALAVTLSQRRRVSSDELVLLTAVEQMECTAAMVCNEITAGD